MEPDPYSWNNLSALFLQADTIQVFSYLLIPFLLFFSALLSGAEKAYFSLPDEMLEHYRHSSNKTDTRVWKLLENPRRTLSTIFFAKSFAYALMLCLVFWFSWQAFNTTPENDSFTVFVAFLLFLALVFLAEILPKVYYTHHPEGLARSLAPFLNFFQKILSPFTGLFLATETAVSRKFNLKMNQSPIEDLQEALDATISEETTSEEKEILRGIVAFGSFSAKQIMRSRTNIVAFDYQLTLPELIPLIEENNYSRVPVFLEDIDTIEGILYMKDLLPHLDAGADFKWQSLLRSPFFVPESKKVGDLLKDFQEMHVHMAIVVDEYGGTSGLVTLEDIIEEIVGDIKDEFDDEDELVYSQPDENTYIFDAKTSLHNFCKITGTQYEKLEEVKGENETLAGLMLELFSRIPRTGAETTLAPYRFKIEAADSKKVITVKVHVNPENNIL
ncbi:gliding motility-associated protein GldE [Adhaeribacter sp. BT258]|uniref:Gliding motility-associated protein GldE n=1 Tax=Adhaeribacter terrigena TaxID=2793070 RepID=A0ABS1C4Z6_9BACT|nr:gliding motility-associated protein GldE [Adhaeribacter terrigena]MBK0404447.1 gliding motility-associated protein GldE [Adhaeribacter terrigena]